MKTRVLLLTIVIVFSIVGSLNAQVIAGSANRQYSLYMKGFNYAGTLPIKFHTFSATLNKSKADLKWTTASEINVSHFVVEKSMDGTNFTDAGVVFAYGNGVDQTDYSYTDDVNIGNPGIIYYRIRSVDKDENHQHSVTRIIRIAEQAEKTINIFTYPNPATNELRITIPGNWQNKKVTYELFNGSGLVAKKIQITNSSQTETLDINSLAKGFYIVRVTCGEERDQQKIVKN